MYQPFIRDPYISVSQSTNGGGEVLILTMQLVVEFNQNKFLGCGKALLQLLVIYSDVILSCLGNPDPHFENRILCDLKSHRARTHRWPLPRGLQFSGWGLRSN